MKIPSLFKKARYQRFKIEPRYYDPVKEEIDARTSRIRAEMKQSLENGEPEYYNYGDSRISGAFTRRSSRRGGVNLMQGVILTLMISGIVGYWYFGNVAVYIILILSSLLLYLKIKRII